MEAAPMRWIVGGVRGEWCVEGQRRLSMAAAVGDDEDGRIGSHGESFFMMWSQRPSFITPQTRQSGKNKASRQNSGNLARFWQSGKILAIWQNSGNLAKFWQSGKILAIWQKQRRN
jgi:hypothetical protein